MTKERWATLSLPMQLMNIESELARAESLQKKQDSLHANECLLRALDLVRSTVVGQAGLRQRELNRLTELLADNTQPHQIYGVTLSQLRQLLQPFAVLVAKERDV